MCKVGAVFVGGAVCVLAGPYMASVTPTGGVVVLVTGGKVNVWAGWPVVGGFSLSALPATPAWPLLPVAGSVAVTRLNAGVNAALAAFAAGSSGKVAAFRARGALGAGTVAASRALLACWLSGGPTPTL